MALKQQNTFLTLFNSLHSIFFLSIKLMKTIANVDSLHQLLQKFSSSQILVVGDIMWDKYVYGEVSRISPEAPVPVLLVHKEEYTPGGAANVLKNLNALQVSCGLVGVVGSDANGKKMKEELQKLVSLNSFICTLQDRPTISKTRLIARHQQLLRVDREAVLAIPQETQEQIIEFIDQNLPQYQAIILSDYDKGLLNPTLIEKIIALAKKHNVYVAVDPQVKNFYHYQKADVITPNEAEASAGMGFDFPKDNLETKNLAYAIFKKLQLSELLITRSERGMALVNQEQEIAFLPTIASEVYDVTGAGDTVISVFTSAKAVGGDSLLAALLANIAGGLVVKKFGSAVVTNEEISSHLFERQLLYKWDE